MKFGQTVAFNAVEEWRPYYIDYDKLKSISLSIERLEEQVRQKHGHLGARPSTDRSMRQQMSLDLPATHRSSDGAAAAAESLAPSASLPMRRHTSVQTPRTPARMGSVAEGTPGRLESVPSTSDRRSEDELRSPLLGSSSASGSTFQAALDQKRLQFRDVLDSEVKKVATFVGQKKKELEGDVAALQRSVQAPQRGTSQTWQQSLALAEKNASHLYVQLRRFAQFIDMNREGFRKIVKKHDKVTEVQLGPDVMPFVQSLLPADDIDAVQKARHCRR